MRYAIPNHIFSEVHGNICPQKEASAAYTAKLNGENVSVKPIIAKIKHTLGAKSKIQTFTIYSGGRTSALSASETAAREKFGKVVAAVMTRMADATKQASDLAAFQAQDKYSTLRGYLFSIGYQNYNSSTKSVDWPA